MNKTFLSYLAAEHFFTHYSLDEYKKLFKQFQPERLSYSVEDEIEIHKNVAKFFPSETEVVLRNFSKRNW